MTDEKLDALYNTFDADGCGKIKESCIKDAFTKFGREITAEEIDEILN